MNILVFSNAISPYHGSEYAVGWNYVINMSKRHKLYVLYGGNIDNIEKYLKTSTLENVTFIYAGNHQSSVNWNRHPLLSQIQVIRAHKLWHKKVLSIASDIINKYDIDLIHFLNPIGFKEPGYLWKLDKPYIWGPLQGVENFPLCLYPILDKRGLLEAIARLFILNYYFFCNTRIKNAFKRADLLVAATPKTKYDLKKIYNKDSVYLPENAIIDIETEKPTVYGSGECLEIISVGSLCDRKAFILQLKTAEYLLKKGYSNFKWTIVGSGYKENELKYYTNTHGLERNVFFTGLLERSEVQTLFKKAHLNVISSLSEATTTVLWESMSKGIPTMSLNHCGMSGVLSDEDSFLIKVRKASKVVNDMSNVIIDIINNPSIIEEKSRNTIVTAKKNTWEKRIDIIEELYRTTIKNYSIRKKSSSK